MLYIAVALTLTGLFPYKSPGVAVDAIGWPTLTMLIKLGGLIGLCSVLMVYTYAHSGVCLAKSPDGLLPRFFSTIHPRFRTPHLGTIAVAGVATLAAALLPISILATSSASALAWSS